MWFGSWVLFKLLRCRAFILARGAFVVLSVTPPGLNLQQTKSDTPRSKYKQLLDSESQISLISMKDAHVETGPLESAASACEPKAPPLSKLSPPVRLLLTKPVLLAMMNYGLLSLLEISFLVLLPIFLAGSLHFSPSSIGLVMGIMGLANGIIQIAFFVPLHRQLGSRNLFSLGVCSIGFMFCAFPFIARSYVRNGGSLGLNVFALLALQMAVCPLVYMAFSKHSLVVASILQLSDTNDRYKMSLFCTFRLRHHLRRRWEPPTVLLRPQPLLPAPLAQRARPLYIHYHCKGKTLPMEILSTIFLRC
jgi:hypothetical protein